MAKPSPDLFDTQSAASKAYTAKDIEVLEGLEPVRRRPGMYIGGTDATALHHLASEILDNSMDEAVAGHASHIDMELKPGNVLVIGDNGRGIPIDPHPKFKSKSALEVIMTTLHAGGKFDGKAYETSGGLHGVGASVVNALSEWMEVDVARDRHAWKLRFERGHVAGKLKDLGAASRRGTVTSFKPDAKIFGLTTGLAVMKINSELGYEPVTYSELTTDDAFWQGCQSCVNYDILLSKSRKNCLCTAMLFDPGVKEPVNEAAPKRKIQLIAL